MGAELAGGASVGFGTTVSVGLLDGAGKVFRVAVAVRTCEGVLSELEEALAGAILGDDASVG